MTHILDGGVPLVGQQATIPLVAVVSVSPSGQPHPLPVQLTSMPVHLPTVLAGIAAQLAQADALLAGPQPGESFTDSETLRPYAAAAVELVTLCEQAYLERQAASAQAAALARGQGGPA